MEEPWRPTKQQLLAANGATVPDLIASHLAVLFCGINPGLYSGATGFHFARPGNRFWPALHAAGFTPRRFAPSEGRALIELGYVSSKDDLKQLTSGAWQSKTASAIGKAIDSFFSTRIAGTTAGRSGR